MSAAPAYITRAQADPRRQLVELMASAAYERGRPLGSSRPPWPETLDQWRQDSRDQMEAALTAAERAGWRIER